MKRLIQFSLGKEVHYITIEKYGSNGEKLRYIKDNTIRLEIVSCHSDTIKAAVRKVSKMIARDLMLFLSNEK